MQVHGLTDGAEWAAFARRLEDSGFDIVTLPDHFGRQLAPVPAMMAAACATTTLKVGAFVFAVDYKHPLVLAKEMATIDVLSGGRVEVSLGAGWAEVEYRQAGLRFDPNGVRVSRLAEGVQVLAGLLSEGPFTFEGEHFRIEGHDGWPTPVQRPRPKILVGGSKRRVLQTAARYGDIVGMNVDLAAPPGDRLAGLRERLAWVEEAAGDRLSELELNMTLMGLVVTEDREAAAKPFADRFGLDVEQVLANPAFLIGPIGELVERVHELRDEIGITYLVGHAEASVDPLTELIAAL